MKKITVVLSLSLLLSGFLTKPIFAAGATLSLSPAAGTFNKGCSFNVDILVDTGGNDIVGVDAISLYDSTRFNATSLTKGTIFVEFPGNSTDTPGKVQVSGLTALDKVFSGSGVLGTVSFSVLDTAPTGASTIKFDFDASDKLKTTDSNIIKPNDEADILSSVTNGNYTIGSGSCSSNNNASSSSNLKGGGGHGAVSTPSATPTPPAKVLPPAGDNLSLLLFGLAGGMLTILGLLGVALL